MLTSLTSAADDLQKYQKVLRFPPALEREFRRDFGERQPPMLRRFFAMGLGLYMSFAILDYFAPLKKWLDKQNNAAGAKVGWKTPTDPLAAPQ